MILVGFLLFVALALYCEYALLRHMGRAWRRSPGGRTYIVLSALPWCALVAGMGYMLAGGDTAAWFMRAFGVVLVLFACDAFAKMIFVLFGYIGRRTGHGRAMGIAATVCSAAWAAVLLGSMTFGGSRIRVERVEVVSPRLPAGFDGFRVALFSDVHTGVLPGRDRTLRNMVETLDALDADVVINCGDIVNTDYRELDGRVLEILSGIRSRCGVYAVLGNHDLGIYIRDTVAIPPAESMRRVAEAQRGMGWTVLRDSSAVLVRGGDSISLTGLSFPEELVHRSHERIEGELDLSEAYSGLPREQFNITLSHAPQAWRRITAAGRGDLTLSGHVHSLQMKLRLGRWQWSPAAWFYDEWSGPYTDGERMLYVNDGIGYAMIPVRLGARPEITLFVLRRSDGSNRIGGSVA
ncbi:MAG TPA: metallophosphoesterase [Candidatus Tidjanibacter gallistercoris]|nr:metallophosphoesterase [Candidatus Tidjanibacter gallistercoris]